MSNLLHHLLAAAWSFTVAAGVMSVLSKGWLARRLSTVDHPAQFDSPVVYALLVVPGFLPVVWLMSGLIHLGASGALQHACCSLISLSGTGVYQWVLGAGAGGLALAQLQSLQKHWRPQHDSHRETRFVEASRRVRRICKKHWRLAEYVDRIRVVDCRDGVCATVGFFDQRVEIARSLVEQLDDSALEAALLHECSHLGHADSARAALLLLSRVINPFSWLLSREAAAWRFAREVDCDSRAVDQGAKPISLAEAIVTAGKTGAGAEVETCAHLCGVPRDAVSARVNLLLVGVQHTHTCGCRTTLPVLGSGFAVAALVFPHLLGGQIISLHCVFEETLKTILFVF